MVQRIERPFFERKGTRLALAVLVIAALGTVLAACGAGPEIQHAIQPTPSGYPAGGPGYPGPRLT